MNLQSWLGVHLDDVWPMEILEACGRLWVGASDGRFFFAEPFADRIHPREVLQSDQLWSGRQSRLRARTAGLWLTMFAAHGVCALNLLPLDDPHRSGLAPEVVWTARPGHRLAADPILLLNPVADSPIAHYDRTLVWLTRGTPDLVLYFKTLSLDAKRDTTMRTWRLNPEKFKGLTLGEQLPVARPHAFGFVKANRPMRLAAQAH